MKEEKLADSASFSFEVIFPVQNCELLSSHVSSCEDAATSGKLNKKKGGVGNV